MKENRRALFDALDALPWRDVPIAHTATDNGHGRITTRTIQVLPAPEDLPFPHVSQVFLIEWYVSDLAGKPVSAVAALGVASPAPGQARPADLAGHVWEQWSIESLHWLRDTLCQEDKSKVRTRSGPRITAALRNLAIGALHLAGPRHHRSHPPGQSLHGSAIHHPRTHIMILERPCPGGGRPLIVAADLGTVDVDVDDRGVPGERSPGVGAVLGGPGTAPVARRCDGLVTLKLQTGIVAVSGH